nr:putative integron gene cassette protein [uncultured bacterium]
MVSHRAHRTRTVPQQFGKAPRIRPAPSSAVTPSQNEFRGTTNRSTWSSLDHSTIFAYLALGFISQAPLELSGRRESDTASRRRQVCRKSSPVSIGSDGHNSYDCPSRRDS